LTIEKTKTFPDAKMLADLRKRKLVTIQKVFVFKISKGPKYAPEFVKEETDLTAEMLARYVGFVVIENMCQRMSG